MITPIVSESGLRLSTRKFDVAPPPISVVLVTSPSGQNARAARRRMNGTSHTTSWNVVSGPRLNFDALKIIVTYAQMQRKADRAK
jgi:hypothetical protein